MGGGRGENWAWFCRGMVGGLLALITTIGVGFFGLLRLLSGKSLVQGDFLAQNSEPTDGAAERMQQLAKRMQTFEVGLQGLKDRLSGQGGVEGRLSDLTRRSVGGAD